MKFRLDPLSSSGISIVNDTTVITGSSSSNSSGSGDVIGPASSTDNAIARYDGATGKLIKDSGVFVQDAGVLQADSYTGPSEGSPFNAYGRDADSGVAGYAAMYGGSGGAGDTDGGDVILGPGTGHGTGRDGQIQLIQSNSPYAKAIIDLTAFATDHTVAFPDKDGTVAMLSDISGSTGITRSIVITSGNITAGSAISTDYVYLVAGAHTITLPTALSNTNRYTIKNNHSANITVNTTSSQTIDGTTSISIAPDESVDIISTNTNWSII